MFKKKIIFLHVFLLFYIEKFIEKSMDPDAKEDHNFIKSQDKSLFQLSV